MISSIDVSSVPALSVEEVFVWAKRRWGHRPSLQTALRVRTLEGGAFHLLHADDSVTLYIPADAARARVSQRTYKAGSDYARDVWRVAHKRS